MKAIALRNELNKLLETNKDADVFLFVSEENPENPSDIKQFDIGVEILPEENIAFLFLETEEISKQPSIEQSPKEEFYHFIMNILDKEKLKETFIQQGKLTLVRILDQLDKRNTLPYYVIQIIEDYDKRGEILTRYKLIYNLNAIGYKKSSDIDSTLMILRDYLNVIVMGAGLDKTIRISRPSDFEKGGYFYVGQSSEEKYNYDKEILKDTFIKQDKRYLVKILDALDNRNTLPYLVIQIIEDYDNRGEILTRSKLIDNLKEKGFKWGAGQADSTLTILRDYLNIIVMGPGKDRTIRLIH